MINLLPPATKTAYRYAQRNVAARRWLAASLLGLVGAGVIGSYGWLSLHRSISTTNQQIASSQAVLKKENLAQTNAQVKDISNSFRLVQRVLSKEILFSRLLKQMATALPPGANLTGLDITSTAGGSGLDVAAEANSYATATQVQVNLADPSNQIFAKADIENISCDAKAAKDPAYPCTITLRAEFAAKNPFLFINQGATL